MAAVLLYVCSTFVVWLCVSPLVVHADSVQYSCASLGFSVDCSGSGLINVPRGIPEWMTRLDLQNNGIKEIRHGDFEGLGNLTHLDLSNNDLSYIDGAVFKDLKKLKILKLDHNKLTEIPIFSIPLNISKLTMAHNHVTKISVEAMAMMPELTYMDVSYNNILGITNGSFQAGSKLVHLNLNNNKIAAVDRGSMNNLTALKVLKMNKNELKELPARVLQNLTSLKTLELMRNKLTVIRGLTFDGLRELQTLKLKRNSIIDLKDAAFWKLPSLQNLQMDHNMVANVTKGWLYELKSLKQLSLAHNKVSKIEDNAWLPCQYLEKLDLSHNRLSAITEHSLSHLTSLKLLNLDHNRISRIDEGSFRDLTYLSTLEINANEIKWAMEDVSGAFRDLVGLTKLGLRSNAIRSIAVHAFSGLQKLRYLHLEDNEITSIQQNAFETLRELRELHFNSSKLICDCDLAWLPEWLKMVNFQHTALGHCFHPPLFRGVPLFQVDPAEFKCNNDEFPKPVILESPKSANGFKGENMTLTCVTAINGDSQPNIHWKKDNIMLDDSRSTVTARSDGDVKRYTSHLNLQDIEDSMAGRYQCVVSNEFGSVFSQRAYINVYVYPVFLKTPKDVTVKAEKPVELQCAATGQPAPVISWQKDGGDNFPAARERRMRMYPNDDRFYIINTRPADEGVYSCFARNEAGVIVANATVTVLETPNFVQPMQLKKSTKRGETTVLQCLASGSPQPKLTWLKDDKELEVTARHFFTVDNQILVIVDTQWSDAGVYSCRMSNSLGTAKGATELQVLSTSGEASEASGNTFGLDDDTTTTGIIIIAVVCCVVGTSLVWVIIIYQTRKRHEMYSATPTDETTLPGEVPSSGYISSDKEGSYSQGQITMAGYHYQDYQMKESGYESSSGQFRANGFVRATCPSDVDEDENNPPTMTAGDKLLQQMKAAHSASSLQYAGSDGDTIGSRQSTSSGQHSGSSDPPSSHSDQWSAIPQLQVDTMGQLTIEHHPLSSQPSPASDDPPNYSELRSSQQLVYPEAGRPLLQTFHPTKSSSHHASKKGGRGSAASHRDEARHCAAERLRHHSDSCDNRDFESPQYRCVACMQAQRAGTNSLHSRSPNTLTAEIHCTNNPSSCFHKENHSGSSDANAPHSNKHLISDSKPPSYPTISHFSLATMPNSHLDSKGATHNSASSSHAGSNLPPCNSCGGQVSPEGRLQGDQNSQGPELSHPGSQTPPPCCCEVLRDSRYCPGPRAHQHMYDMAALPDGHPGKPQRCMHHRQHHSQYPANMHMAPNRISRSRSSNSIGRDVPFCLHCDTYLNMQQKDCGSCGCPSEFCEQSNCPDCSILKGRGTSLSSRSQGRPLHSNGTHRSPNSSRLPPTSPSIPASPTTLPVTSLLSQSSSSSSTSSPTSSSQKASNLPPNGLRVVHL